MKSEDQDLDKLRHSCAHLMAAAVLELWPEAKPTLGPAIKDGFYYDFDFPQPISDTDLPKIEEKMQEILSSWTEFKREEVTLDQAREEFKDNLYKLEMIEELDKAGQTLTIYQSGQFRDLCRGPHIENPQKQLKYFKLLSLAGAYWRGSEKNKMLTRIYGTCWSTQEELDEYLKHLEEVEKRDHRKLIKDLDLVSFHEEGGAGLSYWHPKGGRIRQTIEDFWRARHREAGYDILFTPHIGVAKLWQASGHLDFYQNSMYAPMPIDEQDYYLKPMNCPFHILIYQTKTRSYRELPLRWAELGTVYRYERSGTLHGLMRVRGFTQDDAHIFCTEDQMAEELLGVLDFSVTMLGEFGFKNLKYELSVRDPKNMAKYVGSDEMWQKAEQALVKTLEQRQLSYERMEGEAVFYGPKIDIKIEDALGRTWQCATIQFDFNLPERFDVNYINDQGKEVKPYMIHRTLLGSMERFFGVLLEHYAGALPVWLSPVQVAILPVNDTVGDYVKTIAQELKGERIWYEIYDRDETLGNKIRLAQEQKVPYMFVVGNKEKEGNFISLRTRDGQEKPDQKLEELLPHIRKTIDIHNVEL